MYGWPGPADYVPYADSQLAAGHAAQNCRLWPSLPVLDGRPNWAISVASLVWACRQGSSPISSSLPGAPNASNTSTQLQQRVMRRCEGSVTVVWVYSAYEFLPCS